jgi:hypothetical protein
MRKLAREAVSFILLTSLVCFAGEFAYLYRKAEAEIAKRTAEQARIAAIVKQAKSFLPPNGGDIFDRLLACAKVTHNFLDGKECVSRLDPSRDAQSDIVSETPDYRSMLLSSLCFALYGIPAGIGLWVLYRAIYFAIKG